MTVSCSSSPCGPNLSPLTEPKKWAWSTLSYQPNPWTTPSPGGSSCSCSGRRPRQEPDVSGVTQRQAQLQDPRPQFHGVRPDPSRSRQAR